MVKFIYYFAIVLLLFYFSPSAVFAVPPTISVTFPDTVDVGKEYETEVTISNTTDSFNFKIYGSSVDTKRTKNYAETFNGSVYATSEWKTYPVVQGGVLTKVKFKVNSIAEDQDYIYLSAGIQYGSKNIYSNWVKVNVIEIVETSAQSDNAVEVVIEKPSLSLELPDNIYYGKETSSKVKIQNSDDTFLVKILGSQDKKKYGIIKTINDNDYLNWNSSWEKFPTIKNDGEVSFIVDEVVDSLFIKLRAKNTNTLEYVESDWYDVEIKELIIEDEQEEKELEDSEILDKSKTESSIKKNDKIRIDYSKIPYKPVAFNVYDKEPDNIKNTETDLTKIKQINHNKDKFDVKKVLSNLWQKMLAILPIQKN